MHFGVVLLQPVRGGGPDDAGAVRRPGKDAGSRWSCTASAPGHQLRCGVTVTPSQLRGSAGGHRACPPIIPYCHREGRCAQAGHSLLWLS